MTDKELKKLKRAELIEIMFFLQKELDDLKKENQKLKQDIDELNKKYQQEQCGLSKDNVQAIQNIIQKSIKDCLNNNG